MLSILIADDNKDFDITMTNAILEANSDLIQISGIATNGLEAYEKIKSLHPDIVILDIKMPIMNGTDLVNKLVKEEFELPKIILISSYSENFKKFRIVEFVSRTLSKPFEFETLNKYIKELIDEDSEKNLNDDIMDILSKFDFNVRSVGYSYLVDCIKICLKETKYLNNLEKNLYPYIAKRHSISNPLKIKWSIEKTLNSMYRYTNAEILQIYFPNMKKIPPKFFIKTVVNLLDEKVLL